MAEIQIRLSPEDYKEQVLSSIKKQGKNANLPGFRPGKIPVGMLKKMVGKSVMIEEINKMLQEALNGYVKDQNIDLLGNPIPTDPKSEEFFDLSLTKDLDFAFEIGLNPEFDLKLDEVKEIEVYEIEIDDAYLEKEINNNLERHGDVSNPEIAEKGDILFGQIEEVDEQGEPLEEGFKKMVVLNPTRVDDPEKLSVFEGKELEYSLPFSLDWYSADKQKTAELMFLEPEELDEIEAKALQFTLKRLNRIKPAEMNAEFFEKVLGPAPTPEVPESEEAEAEASPEATQWDEASFRKSLAERLKTDWENELKSELNYRLREKILEVHEIPLPEAYMKSLYKAEQKEPPTDEQVEEAYPNYAKSMKWTLMVDKILQENEELKVNEEDLKAGILDMYRSYYPHIGDEEGEMLVQQAAQNPELIQRVSVRKMEEKVYNYLKEQIKQVPKPITATEFLEKER